MRGSYLWSVPQRLRLAARHEALNAQAAKRWQRALDAALAGRATTW